jgi:hypothetical protein
MKALFFVLSTILFFNCGITDKLYAQSLPVGTPVLDDYYRRMQLLAKVDSTLSFAIKPLLSRAVLKTQNIFDPDSTLKNNLVSLGKGRVTFHLLPLTLQQQFNSHHPYGWNDAAMIPARGYQSMISGGFYLKYGPLSIQFWPSYVYANNTLFDGFASGHTGQDLIGYYASYNKIDWPERFGNNSYKRFSLGQSNIKLTLGPMDLGLSSENLWWGPGIQNALVLTNNAAGFNHITINTTKPVNFFLGYFEAQIIAGRLNDSQFPPLLVTELPNGTNLFEPKRDDSRYFTGVHINYHPTWIPGFTLGLIRTFNAYYSDVKKGGLGDYIPFFIPYAKKNANNGVGDLFPRDQITSLYARWLFKKAQAEIYFEYGWEDNLYNSDDLIQSPEHSRAYILGLRKLINMGSPAKGGILISTEITQTSQHAERSIREIGLWYVNYQLRQGHTNQGQILGSGAGPGGNTQTFAISWVKGLKKIGIDFTRYEHDADFFEGTFPDINGSSRNWVDLAFGLHGDCSYKNFLFNVKLQGIKSFNYEWILKDYTPNQYYIPHNDVYNFHGELGVTYRF